MNLFSTAPAEPFFPAFVSALRQGLFGARFKLDAGDPLALADLTILMPSRRAARAAEAAILEALGGRAAILPRIKALPDVDEAELFLSDFAAGGYAALPPALSPLQRTFMLMNFVRSLADQIAQYQHHEEDDAAIRSLPAEAAFLSAALGKLFDEAATHEADFSGLERLVPEKFDKYWQASAIFLNAIRTFWPGELAERGAIDFGERRRRLIAAETARLASGAGGPILAVAPPAAAPGVARLLAAIARRPDGAVVLPGLDHGLDEACWDSIVAQDEGEPAPTHAQFGYACLLRVFGRTRADVTAFEGLTETPHAAARGAILSEALLPAAMTDLWGRLSERRDDSDWDDALAGVSLIEAQSDGEEALAIALALREAAAQPGMTAALVTPDRVIARRTAAELRRFGLSIDDSAGLPLGRTPPAVFARLVVEAAADGCSPVCLLSLLKHPFAAFGRPAAETRAAARALETLMLRGPRPGRGMSGLREAFARLPAELEADRRAVPPDDLEAAEWLIDALHAAMAPLEEIADEGPVLFARILEAHRAAVDSAAQTPDGSSLFGGEAGEALAQFFSDLTQAEHGRLTLGLNDYPALFGALMADRVVRPRAPSHPRLHIWGLREARLQHADRIILAGLNEGVWPSQPQTDPWLNRPMRSSLRLPQPEENAGLAAHDFAEAFACRETILVRAARSGGAPTVASRLLARLEAVIGSERVKAMRARGRAYLDCAALVDRPEAVKPIARPNPKPPVSTRPLRLSVTEIETWLRDPYSIYARHILRLRPLDPIDDLPTSERGTALHDSMAGFTNSAFAGRNDPQAVAEFHKIGRERLKALFAHPPFKLFWGPRFDAIAEWFVTFEAERRRGAAQVMAEASGRARVPGPAFVFELIGRADRVERRDDGGLAIMDYKTGVLPTPKEIEVGFAPQLPLLGAMAMDGAFAREHEGASLASLMHVKLGGGDPAGETRSIKEPVEAARAAWDGLTKLIRKFQEPDIGYLSMPRPRFRLKYGDYDHLARVREWALVEDGGETS